MSKPVRIAISGRSGCGNTTVSRMLAEKLSVRLINYTFHSMAEEQGVTFDQMCTMAESDDAWDRHLDEEQIRRAREGSCVLGSRLAIWFLHEADVKVYLSASEEVRVRRIQEREGGSVDTVQAATAARDKRDHARYLRLYNIDTTSYTFADLVIDTEFATPEQIVEIIAGYLETR